MNVEKERDKYDSVIVEQGYYNEKLMIDSAFTCFIHTIGGSSMTGGSAGIIALKTLKRLTR